jgi:hypothetical protein
LILKHKIIFTFKKERSVCVREMYGKALTYSCATTIHCSQVVIQSALKEREEIEKGAMKARLEFGTARSKANKLEVCV